MDRRTFVKSISAAFAAPVAALSPAQPIKDIRWELFTDPWSMKYDLTTPWLHASRQVATDGRVLVSAAGGCQLGDGEGRRPNVDKLDWSIFDESGWNDRSELSLGKKHDESGGTSMDSLCVDCMGLGSRGELSRCECMGEGIDVCESCNDSGWIGTQHCSTCSGTGWMREPLGFIAHGRVFCTGLISRIDSLGPWSWKFANWESMGILAFRFGDDGKGFVASLTPEVVPA